MLAKRCAPELGSDRRPRRCVSPDTTWRFCARRDSVCLWSSSADVLRTVCRPGGLSGRHDQGAGGATPGGGPEPLPRVAWLKRCARQLLVFARHFPHVWLPSSPLHKQARLASVAFRHACVCINGQSCLSVQALWPYRPRQVAVGVFGKRSTCYCHDPWPRAVVSADGWWLQLPKLLKPRPQQGSVRPARAPLAAGAAVTITTTSAKGAGDSRSRTSRSPPTCARGTAPPQVSCRRPNS